MKISKECRQLFVIVLCTCFLCGLIYGDVRDCILRDAESLSCASTYVEASNLVARINRDCPNFVGDDFLQRQCLKAGCKMKIDWNCYDEACRIGELRHDFILSRMFVLLHDRESWLILANEIGSLRKRIIPDYKPQGFICSSIHATKAEQLDCRERINSAQQQDAEQQYLRQWSWTYWLILKRVGISRCTGSLRADELNAFLNTLAVKAMLQETEIEELRREAVAHQETRK